MTRGPAQSKVGSFRRNYGRSGASDSEPGAAAGFAPPRSLPPNANGMPVARRSRKNFRALPTPPPPRRNPPGFFFEFIAARAGDSSRAQMDFLRGGGVALSASSAGCARGRSRQARGGESWAGARKAEAMGKSITKRSIVKRERECGRLDDARVGTDERVCRIERAQAFLEVEWSPSLAFCLT